MFEIPISDGDIDDVVSALNKIHSDQPPLVLDAARRAAIKDFHDIQACPGSGKTTLVGLKLLCLIQRWPDPFRGICVLTHTNVARDEILKRIRCHPTGHKLQKYPHFVGTIQEFVNTFLALPACRSEGGSVARIDDAYCEERLRRMTKPKTRAYLDKKFTSVAELRYVWRDNAMVLNVPGFAGFSNSDSYKDLIAAKAKLVASGAYFYSEMYALGRKLMSENPHVLEILRHRFPVVMIDEMQDAQKFQDDLINLIFEGGHIQRLGDPDQSIFDGLGNEEPNSSYNNAVLLPIAESHRFVPDVATHITGLSHRKLTLTTTYAPQPNAPRNTVILYDGATLPQVLESFTTIAGQLDPQHRKIIKAVGGVSENKLGTAAPLNLRSYWPEFDRTHHVKSFVPASLCQAVAYCAACLKGDVHRYHQVLLQAIADVLRQSGVRVRGKGGKDYPPSRLNLAVHLHERSTTHRFKLLCAAWIMSVPPTAETWAVQILELSDILGISITSPVVKDLLSFDPSPPPTHVEETDTGNCFVGANGVKVQLSTIHSVKGETHDATLVLETKYQKLFDVKEMIPFILNPALAAPVFDPTHPKTNESIRASFMKKIYVAASRPRHLLCLAIGRAQLTAAQIQELSDQNWQIVDA